MHLTFNTNNFVLMINDFEQLQYCITIVMQLHAHNKTNYSCDIDQKITVQISART